jgi:hypothetical protein
MPEAQAGELSKESLQSTHLYCDAELALCARRCHWTDDKPRIASVAKQPHIFFAQSSVLSKPPRRQRTFDKSAASIFAAQSTPENAQPLVTKARSRAAHSYISPYPRPLPCNNISASRAKSAAIQSMFARCFSPASSNHPLPSP